MSDSQRPEGSSPGPAPTEGVPPLPEPPPTREGEAPPTLPNIPSLESSPTLRHLAGRYVVLDMLGQGGMSIVLAAYDVRLDRRVALKLLRSHPDSEPLHFQPRLLREAQAMARLSHPHVVAVYDAGTLEDGTLFIAMEYVEGQTLRQWCQQSCSWREVLAMYLAAGRGLAAAHAAGLVHRDFKPDNVLVGRDGRVRVTDFGLARVEAMPVLTPTPSMPEALAALVAESHHTQAGALVGTPGYMAPELLRGRAADARSDLFAFCVALYESLYGQPAFPGATATERFRAQREGRLNPPPPNSPVPAWVSRLVLRGLAEEPQERPDSMQALIAALEDDPEVRRRAWLRSGALVAGALGLAALAAAGWVLQRGAPCTDMDKRLAGVWDMQQQERVRQALEGTGLPYARDTATRVHAALEAYSRDWVRLRTEACEASRSQGSKPQGLVLQQVGCLERRRNQLRALVELLGQRPDKELLPKASELARTLPSLEQCLEASSLDSALPESHPQRAQVEALQEQVDRLETLWRAGKYRAGLELADSLLPQVEALGYTPLHAQALFQVGRLASGAADHVRAEALLKQALINAARAKDDRLMARAWNRLIWTVEVRQSRRLDLVSLEQALLEASVERAGDELARAESFHILGGVLYGQGRYAESQALYAQAAELMVKALGPEHPFVSSVLSNRGVVLAELGRLEEARDCYERALAIDQKVLGPNHPEVSATLLNLGRTLLRLGRLEEAGVQLQRALRLQESMPERPFLAETLLGVGEWQWARGEHLPAVATFERAEQLAAPSERAEVQFTLARALWRLPPQRPRALRLASQARESFERSGNTSKAAQVSAWLAAPAPLPSPPPAPQP